MRAGRADDQEGHAQKHRLAQDGIDDRGVDDGDDHEQSRQPVARQPPLVARARHPPDGSRPSGRPQARRKRPHREHEQTDQRDVSERVSERRRVPIRSGAHERDVRDQEQHAGDRGTTMPHRNPIEPAERPLDRRQHRREHQRAREQQHRLGAAQLTEEATHRLAAGPCHHPQHREGDRNRDEHHHPGTTRPRDRRARRRTLG